MRLIDADALQENLRGVEVRWWTDGSYINYDDTTITEIIDKQPTIEAKEVVHGEWIEQPQYPGCLVRYKCNVCGESQVHGLKFNFCPECGAKMV